jgi:hypothetical protein
MNISGGAGKVFRGGQKASHGVSTKALSAFFCHTTQHEYFSREPFADL